MLKFSLIDDALDVLEMCLVQKTFLRALFALETMLRCGQKGGKSLNRPLSNPYPVPVHNSTLASNREMGLKGKKGSFGEEISVTEQFVAACLNGWST